MLFDVFSLAGNADRELTAGAGGDPPWQGHLLAFRLSAIGANELDCYLNGYASGASPS